MPLCPVEQLLANFFPIGPQTLRGACTAGDGAADADIGRSIKDYQQLWRRHTLALALPTTEQPIARALVELLHRGVRQNRPLFNPKGAECNDRSSLPHLEHRQLLQQACTALQGF